MLIRPKDDLLLSMKNLTNTLKQKLISKYTVSDSPQTNSKRTDINVLLNRVKSDKKQEVIKKFYFSDHMTKIILDKHADFRYNTRYEK